MAIAGRVTVGRNRFGCIMWIEVQTSKAMATVSVTDGTMVTVATTIRISNPVQSKCFTMRDKHDRLPY